MSLIGSLEDLNLGDILQIIYLSQKSGALVIRSGEGEGRIIFRDGLVCGGRTKGGAVDLRGLLVGGDFVAADAFDPLAELCAAEGTDLEAEIVKRELLSADRIDAIRRESVEIAVNEMFRWETGEFSFDLQRQTDTEGSELLLARGINPQFLAMERVRLEDESGRGGEFEEEGDLEDDPNEMSAEEMFGVVPDDPDPQPDIAATAPLEAELLPELEATPVESEDPIDALARVTAERVSDDPFDAADSDFAADDFGGPDDFASPEELADADLLDPNSSLLDEDPVLAPMDEPARVLEENPNETTATLGEPVKPSPAFGIETRSAPIIAIGPDLVAMEWTKKTLKGPIEQIHIFQRCDLGLNRIRQYLARAVTPLVLVAPDTPGDPSGGIRNVGDFVKRLKAQAPGMTVIWLCEDGGPAPPASSAVEGALTRPATRDFRSPAAARTLETLAAKFREDLAGLTGVETRVAAAAEPSNEPSAPAAQQPTGTTSEPQEITAALGGASSRGEILPLVIHFARETFARVAMFMVRDGTVMGIAQSGLDACGGPDDHGMRGLNLEGEDCAWLREVLSSRQSRVSGPSGHGDYKLAALLGDRAAEQAYLAPIESDGQIVAVLYADNLPGGEPIGDISLVEEALRQAGLALDRAVLARTQQGDPALG